MTASVLCRRAIPAPSPQLAHIWRLLEESACSLQPGLAELALLSFFINHPLPPPDPVCPAPLNLLQFVSSERCRESCLRGQVWLLCGLLGRRAPLPSAGRRLCLQSTPLLGSVGCSPRSFLTEQSFSIYFLSFVLKCQVGRPGTCANSLYALQTPRKKPVGPGMDLAGKAGPLKGGFPAWAQSTNRARCEYRGEQESMQKNSVCKGPVA